MEELSSLMKRIEVKMEENAYGNEKDKKQVTGHNQPIGCDP